MGDVGVDYLVLVDQSLSMGDAGYDTAVRTEVKKLIDGMRSVDRVGFISFAVQPGTQKKFVQAAEAKSLLDGLSVDDPGGTNLGLALASAADLIDKTPLDNPPRLVGVVLLSDAKEDVPAGQPYAKIDPSTPGMESPARALRQDRRAARHRRVRRRLRTRRRRRLQGHQHRAVVRSPPGTPKPSPNSPARSRNGRAGPGQAGAAAVDAEKGKGVEARWIVPDTLDGTFDVPSDVPLVLELKATTARVPVRVSDLRRVGRPGLRTARPTR
ncbi:vWA domain-containing protein [Yinghuangia aomiensis]